MKKTRQSALKFQSLLTILVILLVAFFGYRSLFVFPPGVNWISEGNKKLLPSIKPTPTPTADPFGDIHCTSRFYKIPLKVEPQNLPSDFAWSKFFTESNVVHNVEKVVGGEYYAFIPVLHNDTNRFISTFDSLLYKLTPYNNAQYYVTPLGHGLYYSAMRNGTSFVHLGKIALTPNEQEKSYPNAYFIYWIRPNPPSFPFGFALGLSGGGIDSSYTEECTGMNFERAPSSPSPSLKPLLSPFPPRPSPAK